MAAVNGSVRFHASLGIAVSAFTERSYVVNCIFVISKMSLRGGLVEEFYMETVARNCRNIPLNILMDISLV